MAMDLPKKYKHLDIEAKWQKAWSDHGTYHYEQNSDKKVFSVDTPPPTVSGALHVGHVFSYTQTDVQARFERMRGKNIFYPMGWDDNGLPTERRVQNVFSITCDPTLPYDPNWTPVKGGRDKKTVENVSRRNFIEACLELTQEDEKAFEELWKQLGLSIDWRQNYATIDPHCQKTSQLSFLEMQEKGFVYNHESPTMWDTDFRTAVAQAEIEDRDRPGAYHKLKFGVEGGGDFVIATTRPELLPACIAVVAHPDDARYQALFGKNAITPLFQAKVPILASTHADPEKGSGILMVCTFGDAADVDWWKQNDLPIKQVIGQNGRFIAVDFNNAPFNSLNPQKANAVYSELTGLKIKQAQTRIVELLSEARSGFDGSAIALQGEAEAMTHPVKFYEKGESPIEFMTTRQWFVNIMDHKADLLKQGDKINWYPSFMKSRYTNWVEGLNQDWCISRQRFFGVPFPVWYPVDATGNADYSAPIFAKKSQLPLDPMTDVPEGFTEAQRGQAGGFIGDADVMDTWATSSLTPQIASGWAEGDEKHKKIFPFDVRPQSHEIIRTWAFYTITKAWIHDNDIPWKNVTISGWVLDPDRKKMSKSKGNVVTPNDLLTEHSSDAIRYWSARAKLGADTAFDATVFKIGQKLSTKIFNASKFVLMQLDGVDMPNNLTLNDVTEVVDLSYLSQLRHVVSRATAAFEKMDYAGALEITEAGFWMFCDHYIELVKTRAYRDENQSRRRSALAALCLSLKTFLQLFAPHLPYVTEEVYSWAFAKNTADSIHRSKWPDASTWVSLDGVDSDIFDAAKTIMSEIRTVKTQAGKSMKHEVKTLIVNEKYATEAQYGHIIPDIILAGSIEDTSWNAGAEWVCTLAA